MIVRESADSAMTGSQVFLFTERTVGIENNNVALRFLLSHHQVWQTFFFRGSYPPAKAHLSALHTLTVNSITVMYKVASFHSYRFIYKTFMLHTWGLRVICMTLPPQPGGFCMLVLTLASDCLLHNEESIEGDCMIVGVGGHGV